MSKRTFHVGDKVHVEFDGEVAFPSYATDISAMNLAHNGQNYGWLEVDDGHARHVVWVGTYPIAPEVVKHIGPEYELGQAYADATGRHYIYTGREEAPWLAPSGIYVGDSRPTKPMTRLVIAEDAA